MNAYKGYSDDINKLNRSPGRLEIVKYLIEKGANVEAKDTIGNTPIHFSTWQGKQKIDIRKNHTDIS